MHSRETYDAANHTLSSDTHDYTYIQNCSAESFFFNRALFLDMWGGIWLTSLTPHTFLIPWVEQCITKSVCAVNLWGSRPDCACRAGADDFPVLHWGITLTGQQGCWMVHKFMAAGWERGNGRGKDCTMGTLKSPDLWVSVFFGFWETKLKLFFSHSRYFFFSLWNNPILINYEQFASV